LPSKGFYGGSERFPVSPFIQSCSPESHTTQHLLLVSVPAESRNAWFADWLCVLLPFSPISARSRGSHYSRALLRPVLIRVTLLRSLPCSPFSLLSPDQSSWRLPPTPSSYHPLHCPPSPVSPLASSRTPLRPLQRERAGSGGHWKVNAFGLSNPSSGCVLFSSSPWETSSRQARGSEQKKNVQSARQGSAERAPQRILAQHTPTQRLLWHQGRVIGLARTRPVLAERIWGVFACTYFVWFERI
jgi:hypothetical protein